jgi:DNA polymerase-3 subunit gamma/tau
LLYIIVLHPLKSLSMSYLVLARKYRPKNFTYVVGQKHIVQALSNALGSQRLHHAYLFSGTRGVGKTTIARILAKSLNCIGPDGQGQITVNPCDTCSICQGIDTGNFTDYLELDAASHRGVEDIQHLLEQAVYKPVQGRFKVFMIDEVHMLSNTAFNAMLKTLEEPPDYLKFILATTDPQKIPATVLSRCLQFNLRPLPIEIITVHLKSILEIEGIHYDDASIEILAHAAQGSVRDALSLTDQAIAYSGGQISQQAVQQMLGVVDQAFAFELISALAQNEGLKAVQKVSLLREKGYNATYALDTICKVLQEIAIVQLATDRREGHQILPSLENLAKQVPADEVQLLYSICLQGKSELGLVPDEYTAFTMLLLRFLALKVDPVTTNSVVKDEKKKSRSLNKIKAPTP